MRNASAVVMSAVEGLADEAVIRRLIEHVGGVPGPTRGKKGKHELLQCLGGYNRAARHVPWVVLVDLDLEADCAPLAKEQWLPEPEEGMRLRVVVSEIGSRRGVGPAYASRVIEFAGAFWRPDVAADRADSLRRCLHRLSELVAATP